MFKKHNVLTFSKQQVLGSYKLKEVADDTFKFDENGRKFSKQVENTVGKGEIACNALTKFAEIVHSRYFHKHVDHI